MDLRRTAFGLKARTVRRRSGGSFRELALAQHLAVTELTQLQASRSVDLARHVMSHSPFYRHRWKQAGVEPARLREPGAWAEVPIMDRTTVKENAEEIAVVGVPGRAARPALTGGSTGQPIRVDHDARFPALTLAWRMYSWWGVDPWDDLARVGRWSLNRRQERVNRLSWWPSRQLYLDAADITVGSMTAFHEALHRVRPALIEGYVGAMIEFADFLESRQLTVPAPTAVATTAAPLTQAVRSRLEAVLGAPVHDEYRGAEVPWLAGECSRRDGLHINADWRIIEVVDDLGRPVPPGEVGDIVVTDLANRVFPLIRYRNGDQGSLRAGCCPCGITLPLMEPVQGRTSDVIRLPSGRVVLQGLVAVFSRRPAAVSLFQIHQLADHSITVRVVPGPDADWRAHVDDAVEALRARLHDEVPVRLEVVDSLPYTGGKVKYLISDVPAPDSSQRA